MFPASQQQQPQKPSQVVPFPATKAVGAVAGAVAAPATVKLRNYLYLKSFSSLLPLPIILSDHLLHDITFQKISRQQHRQRLKRSRRKRSISSSSGDGSTCCSQLSLYYRKLRTHKLLLCIRRRRKSRSRIRNKIYSTYTSASTSVSHSTSVTPARGRSPVPVSRQRALTASNIIPAMTVHEKGDFITLRGANPETGYISPSIISLQNARFHTRLSSKSNSNSRSRSHSHSPSNQQLDSCHADLRRKTPTSPGEALQQFLPGNDGHAALTTNPCSPDAFTIAGEALSRAAGNVRGPRPEKAVQILPLEGLASANGSYFTPDKPQNKNTYSADSPTFDPFVAPMPSAENPQPYNSFVTMPLVPAKVDDNLQLKGKKIKGSMVIPQNGPLSTTANKPQQQRQPLLPHNEVVELSCAPPSSSSSPKPLIAFNLVNTSSLGSVQRKPVGSSSCSYPNKILSSMPFKEASRIKAAPKQVSTGKEGSNRFLEKLKSVNKQRTGIKILSKPIDHSHVHRHEKGSRILLIDKFDPEKLYKTGWQLAKTLSVIYLLWLTIRILFALRQILDVALVPLRIVIMIVAWFFRR